MGQIIIPTDRKIKGPWLLDNKSLEELNEALIVIETKLNEAFSILVDKTAESKLEEYSRYENEMTIEKAKEKLKESYAFKEYEKYALLVTKEGKKIKDVSLLALLKDSNLNEYKLTELRIQFTNGPCEFSMAVSSKYNGDLEIRIKALNDEIFNDINYEIHKWIDNHKPNMGVQIWSSWFPLPAFPIFMFLLLTSTLFFKSRSDIYKSQLAEESSKLLKDGFTDQETTKAIEIILQQQIGYVPDSFNPEITINKTTISIWIFALITFVILMIKPMTVIGVGKNKRLVYFYKKWIYFVLVFIPLSIILPIIRSRFK